MRVAIFDPSFPGFPKELARGDIEQGSDTITNLKPTEGRGLGFGRRLQVVPLEGGHIGQAVVMQIRGDEGGNAKLHEPFPLKK